jgi:protein-tyrosine phosphatase
MKILFVCSGNISRSFLAEALLRREIRDRRLEHVSVASAGLYAYPGTPPDPEMVAYLLHSGILRPDHKAKQLTEKDAHWADMILVMEESHAEVIGFRWPQWADKVAPLGKYLPREDLKVDIVDPYGLSSEFYRMVQYRIQDAIQGLIRHLEALEAEHQNDQAQVHRRR